MTEGTKVTPRFGLFLFLSRDFRFDFKNAMFPSCSISTSSFLVSLDLMFTSVPYRSLNLGLVSIPCSFGSLRFRSPGLELFKL